MAAVFKGNDYLPLKFASVSFYCQVSERLKMSNIISLLVLEWNHKGKYYMIPLKKVVLILNILTIRTNLYGY
jgi:hypothetical protein